MFHSKKKRFKAKALNRRKILDQMSRQQQFRTEGIIIVESLCVRKFDYTVCHIHIAALIYFMA